MKRFELSTLSLARRCSTTELHPQNAASVDVRARELKTAVEACRSDANPKIMDHGGPACQTGQRRPPGLAGLWEYGG